MKNNLQNRRDFLKTTAMSIAVTSLPGCSEGKQSFGSNREKPNLLFIMTDQQRSDALSIAGNTVLETLNLDRLAKQGAYFKNAYSPCAVCCPARSSVLTGHTVENTHMRTNGLAYYPKEKGLMAMPTFDEILTDEGYHCEYYGKWHSLSSHTDIYKNPVQASKNGNSVFDHGGQKFVWLDSIRDKEPIRPLKPGEFYDNMSERPYRTNSIDRHHGKTPDELKALSIRVTQSDQHGELLIGPENTLTAYQAKQTIAAIERLKDKPFSITCSFHFPHSPMLPVEPYHSMYPAKDMTPPVSIDDDMSNSPYEATNGRKRLLEYRDKEKIKYMISNYYGLVKEIDDWMGEMLSTLDRCGLRDNTLVIYVSDHGEMLGSHGMREKNVFYEESAHIPLLMRFPRRIKRNTTVDGYVSMIEMMIPYSVDSEVINALYDLNTDPHEMKNLIGKNPDRHRYAGKTEELRASLLEWLKKNRSSHYEGVKKRKLI